MSGEEGPVCLPEEEKRGKKQGLNEDKTSSGTTCLQPLFFFFPLLFFSFWILDRFRLILMIVTQLGSGYKMLRKKHPPKVKMWYLGHRMPLD